MESRGMSNSEAISKMLRSVLQSSKSGVSISSLQSEYRSLCGQNIPLKRLGFSQLEDFLRSIPSVVRLEHRMGELKCFAAVCKETIHIAELVARQKSSKKSGSSHVVNCRMRFKQSNPYRHSFKPTSSLRQPSAGGSSNRSHGHGGFRSFSASGDYRQLDPRWSSNTPVEHRQPVPMCVPTQRKETCAANDHRPKVISAVSVPEQYSRPNMSKASLYDEELVQSRMTQLLKQYCSGLWLSKISEVYNKMFNQKLHPQVLIDLEKWVHVCMVEEPSCNNRADRLVYPPLPPKFSDVQRSSRSLSTSPSVSQHSLCPSTPEEPTTPSYFPQLKASSKSPVLPPTFIFPRSDSPMLSTVTLRSPVQNPALAPRRPLAATRECRGKVPPLANGSAVASSHPPQVQPLPKLTLPPPSVPAPLLPPSGCTVPPGILQKLKQLLTKYNQGLWVHAVPKLFMDTYKMQFPDNILNNLSLLLGICSVEYPISHDKKRAILYISESAHKESTEGLPKQSWRHRPPPSGVEPLGHETLPPLSPPSEQYPSVLVTEVKSSRTVTIRYVGKNYSNAQEAVEDKMRSFYSQSSSHSPLSKPVVGQLVAVRGEDGDELARAQIIQIMAQNKVMVYYVDYGFSAETSASHLLQLHQDFLSLPFQAANVTLAGLESFPSHPQVQSSLEKLAVGKILLMETLEPVAVLYEMPVAVLYDTSQDDDVNINSACLKSLRDNTMSNPLSLNATYQDVCVTKVCADGIIYCNLPSRGREKLNKLLETVEAFFIYQITPESLVSKPFSGKFCFACYNGKWSRVEITNIYNNRVVEILFFDLAISATVEVTSLREIPSSLLPDFTVIPPQAVKCCLTDLNVPEGGWSPEVIQKIKQAFIGSEDCTVKILNKDEFIGEKLVYVNLFTAQWPEFIALNKNMALSRGISIHTGLRGLVENLMSSSSAPTSLATVSNHIAEDVGGTCEGAKQPLPLPPPLELPQPGQNIDVFVPLACHPGYFVLQPWQNLHKLTVLMGEMILYYNQEKASSVSNIQKGDIYAARIEKNWHRVQVKAVLSNGLVSVYELDYGKHEFVHSGLIRPLMGDFRHLPFQAVTAKLAGVKQHGWTEEVSILFRNHVEKQALVAQVECVHQESEGKGELWERRMSVYLVDTKVEDRDVWIHTLMANMDLSHAA